MRTHEVKVEGDHIVIGSNKIKVTAIKDPSQLPHAELGVDIALECTGIFTSKEKASAHLAAGGSPARTVMVGDSATDVRTAQNAGIPVVGVTFGYTDAPIASFGPDVVIDRFDELWDGVARLGVAAQG